MIYFKIYKKQNGVDDILIFCENQCKPAAIDILKDGRYYLYGSNCENNEWLCSICRSIIMNQESRKELGSLLKLGGLEVVTHYLINNLETALLE